MPDREKVIKRLGVIINAIVDGYIHEPDRAVNAITDAIDLLKEHDSVEPIPYHRSDGTIFKYECRQCRTKIFKNDLFCRHCGRGVKWNG